MKGASALDKETCLSIIQDIFSTNEFVKHCGIIIDDVECGVSHLHMDIKSDIHTNITGYVHGGALNTLANTAVGVACCTVGARTVTLNITTDFISNLQAGHTAWAESRVKHRGHSTIVLTCDIFEKMPDGTKRPLTHSIASMYVKADDDRVPKKW